MKPLSVEFESAKRAMHEARRLPPREAYVLLSAPIRGVSQRRREGAAHWTMWFVGDENLSNVVDGLLQRGLPPAGLVRGRPMPI